MQVLRNRYYTAIIMLLSTAGLYGCYRELLIPGPQPLSIQQRAAMQTRELQGDFDTGFSATISVLQDEGWQIDVVDKLSGIIQAVSLKRQDILGPHEDWYAERDPKYREKIINASKDKGPRLLEWTRWEQFTAHIEPWGENTIRHRITITKSGLLPPNTYSYDDKKGRQKISTAGGKEQSVIIENPATYQYLFQRIQRAVFIRQSGPSQ